MQKKKCKQVITGAVLIVLVLVFGVILPQVYTPRENVRRFQKVTDLGKNCCGCQEARSADELAHNSDLVVVMRIDKQEDEGVVKPFGHYLLATGSVEKVISGDAQSGDQLLVFEPCDYFESHLRTFHGYYPMNVGESYLLFLRQEKDETSRLYGRYRIVDNIYGKYPLDAKTGLFCRWYLNMAEELEIADMDAIPTYIAEYQLWYEQVRKLYPEVFA